MKYLNLLCVVGLIFFLGACKSASPKSLVAGRLTMQNISDVDNNPEFKPVCLNKSESAAAFVYLHGMDVSSVSEEEKANREKLLRIAAKLHISVVVPRAASLCPTNPNQLCWGWVFDQAELNQIKKRISSAVETCGVKKVIALVGFSNGGYAVNALHSKCAGDQFGQLISVGAMLDTSAMALKYNQACSGQMVRLIGRQDKFNNSQAAQKLVTDNKLENLIQVVTFDGGHEIPENLLQEQLQKRIQQIR